MQPRYSAVMCPTALLYCKVTSRETQVVPDPPASGERLSRPAGCLHLGPHCSYCPASDKMQWGDVKGAHRTYLQSASGVQQQQQRRAAVFGGWRIPCRQRQLVSNYYGLRLAHAGT